MARRWATLASGPPARKTDAADVYGRGFGFSGNTIVTSSKYIVAVRGRHVFNPAAFGAVVVGVTGLSVSWWWVGSAALHAGARNA